MGRIQPLVAIVCLAVLASCEAPPSPHDVLADRATFAAVAPRYLRYLEADPTLDTASRASCIETVETWDLRIRMREQAAGIGSAAR